MFEECLKKILQGRDLTFNESEKSMDIIMSGDVSDIELASFLTALKLKGETADEIGGCAVSMLRHASKISAFDKNLVDIVGTGGDGANTFNISTTAAFVVAGAGVTVAKHGNVAVSSSSGSADVLRELGIKIDLTPEKMEDVLNSTNIAFLFAQKLHPAMKYAVPVRKTLKTRTIFNILGPLCNPANPKKMTIGVYSKELCFILAEAAKRIGKEHVLVVHGEDGLDEITTTRETAVCELRNGSISEYSISPEQFGMKIANFADIAGGGPAENAEILIDILTGKNSGSKRDIVILNAASAILTSGKADKWEDAISLANLAIDSGQAFAKLNELKKVTNC